MLSIKKNLGLLAMTVALAACASNPNDLPDFPEHEYAATQQVGEGVINGDLYLTSASGAIQKGTNTKVTLEPATSYMKAYYAKFGNLDAAKRDPDVQPPVLDPPPMCARRPPTRTVASTSTTSPTAPTTFPAN